MNNEPFVTQQQHEEYVKTGCTMANLTDAIDEILQQRPELFVWFNDYEGDF